MAQWYLPVTSNVVITNVTGPLDFSFGAYKLLPESPLSASANMTGVAVPAPASDEFTVGGFNIENFAGSETRRRKASLAIRQLMRSPDVIGHIEILDLATLQTLADQVNSDALAAGEPNPAYQAVLVPALTGTQNVGFLVKTSRVRIDGVSQERAADTFVNPVNGQTETLHDRPPLVLRATVDAFGLNPRPVIVVVNHLRSFIDIELVGGEGPRVRAKRKAQAESTAGLLQELQTLNPGVAVISIGDYNAYQFNDGYTDPIATLLGTPTPDDALVVDESPDLVDPDFVNLTDTLPASERYSFIFEGTPQALDHVLLNSVAASYVQRYAIARGNADFPELPESLYSGDATRPERSSDHDMPVAYFRFPPPSADLRADQERRPPDCRGRRASHLHDHRHQRRHRAVAERRRHGSSIDSSRARLVQCVGEWRLRRSRRQSDGDLSTAGSWRVRSRYAGRHARVRGAGWRVDLERRHGRRWHGGSGRGQQLGERVDRRGERRADDYGRVSQPHAVAPAVSSNGSGDDRLHGRRRVQCGDDDARRDV